jgi:hypothetical protein
MRELTPKHHLLYKTEINKYLNNLSTEGKTNYSVCKILKMFIRKAEFQYKKVHCHTSMNKLS